MAEAEKELAARRAAGRKDDIVPLLVLIGYRRAINIVDRQLAKPTTSIDAVFHVADESTPSPEEEAIRRDQHERVTKAMSHLPERERLLLTGCYYDGMSIREAGRQVGWGKSSADRHHRAALEKLKLLLDPTE